MGELVEAGFAEEGAAFGDAGIVFEFEIAFPFFTCGGIGFQQCFQAFFRIDAHAAEFVAGEGFAVFADAGVPEDDGAGAVFVNPGGDDEKYRGDGNSAEDGESVIENGFYETIHRAREVIFQAEHDESFVEEAFNFGAFHGDADEVRDDAEVFHEGLDAVDEGGEVFLRHAGGGDEGVADACFFNDFFGVFKDAEDGKLSQYAGLGLFVFEEADDAVGHADVACHGAGQEGRGFPGADDEDGCL